MNIVSAPTVASQRVPLAPPWRPIRPHPYAHDSRDPVLAWQAHLDAGRIGTPIPLAPEHRATLEATERALGIAAARAGAVW